MTGEGIFGLGLTDNDPVTKNTNAMRNILTFHASGQEGQIHKRSIGYENIFHRNTSASVIDMNTFGKITNAFVRNIIHLLEIQMRKDINMNIYFVTITNTFVRNIFCLFEVQQQI